MRALCLCLRRGRHKKIQTSFSNAAARACVRKASVNHAAAHARIRKASINQAAAHARDRKFGFNHAASQASRHGKCRTSHARRFEIASHTSRGATCAVATKRRISAMAQTRPAHRWLARPMRDRCVHVGHFASARQETLSLVALHKAAQSNDGGACKALSELFYFHYAKE